MIRNLLARLSKELRAAYGRHVPLGSMVVTDPTPNDGMWTDEDYRQRGCEFIALGSHR
jgi:hypothetical protein